ncbi:dolichyl-phosphate beta-glucosyltransferase [Deinococcus sp.]|uniref:dolichyl-phosphate beta-glucosyltransferase n=1 Tax=Deinococcus sp. TaxID=47478 RepID=UPI003C7979FB
MSYSEFQIWRDAPVKDIALSVVIPTYNEAERILPTLAAIAVSVSGLGIPWELIVSDDGSRDGTADLIGALGWSNLRVLQHANTGKGGAVWRGVTAARGARVLFADADNSTPIEELPRLLAQLDRGYEVVVGSRAASGATETNKSALRRLLSGGLRLTARTLSGVTVQDTQCGFKLFGPQAVRELFSRQQMQGFSFDLELLYLAHKLGLRVAEVPVHWFDAPGSKVSSVRDSLRFVRDIVAVRRLDQRGVYNRSA